MRRFRMFMKLGTVGRLRSSARHGTAATSASTRSV